MTKKEYGLIFDAIERHCVDIFNSCYVQPDNPEKKRVFIDSKQFIRMLSANIDRDKSLPEVES